MTVSSHGIYFSFLSSEYPHGPRVKHARFPTQHVQWHAGGSDGSSQQVVGLVLAKWAVSHLSLCFLVFYFVLLLS